MGRGGSNLIGIASVCIATWRFVSPICLARSRKGRFLNVIFDHIKLRKLDPSEDTATKRSCWVYYTCHVSIRIWIAEHVLSYNTLRRGLAKLLISMERQCEGLIWWDKRQKFLPRLFYVHKPGINFNAEAGRVVGDGIWIYVLLTLNYLFYENN